MGGLLVLDHLIESDKIIETFLCKCIQFINLCFNSIGLTIGNLGVQCIQFGAEQS